MVSAHINKILDVSGRSGKRRGLNGSDPKAQISRALDYFRNGLSMVIEIPHHSTTSETVLTNFELRFNHE